MITFETTFGTDTKEWKLFPDVLTIKPIQMESFSIDDGTLSTSFSFAKYDAMPKDFTNMLSKQYDNWSSSQIANNFGTCIIKKIENNIVVESWNFFDIWAKSIDFGALDWSTSEAINIYVNWAFKEYKWTHDGLETIISAFKPPIKLYDFQGETYYYSPAVLDKIDLKPIEHASASVEYYDDEWNEII